MLKLFAVLLGGRASGCHIELHDVVFIIGNSLEETYPRLVHKWFGHHKRLHVDSSVELKYIDGYEIYLKKQKPSNQQKKLFFVNFGAYKSGFFGEMHEVNFYVCDDKAQAVAKAKQTLCTGMHLQHCDDNLNVEDYLDDLSLIEEIDGYYLHLIPTAVSHTLEVTSDYRRLDVPKIIEEASKIKALTAVE